SVLDELAAFTRDYARFYSAMYPASLYRAGMVRKFLARHPADTDVDLLDLYHGIFEPAESSRPSEFPEPPAGGDAERSAARAAFERCRNWFAARARDAAGKEEIAMSAADWDTLAGGRPVPPYSCGVLFQLAARD